MKTQEAIFKRTSVREFSNKPVKIDAVLEAIDSANHAPFAGNINNLKFIIVESKENKNYIAEFSQQLWVSQASWIILVCSESKKLEEIYQERGITYSAQQTGAAIENILLSLTDQGIASCWVGAFAEHELKVKFKIPQNFEIQAIIPLGYAKSKNLKKKRKTSLESKIFWDKWDVKNKPKKYPFKDPSTYVN